MVRSRARPMSASPSPPVASASRELPGPDNEDAPSRRTVIDRNRVKWGIDGRTGKPAWFQRRSPIEERGDRDEADRTGRWGLRCPRTRSWPDRSALAPAMREFVLHQ